MGKVGSERGGPPRAYRCKLVLPGSESRFFAKAAASAADAVCLDLEDAVAPADKDRARANVVAALRDIDWGDKQLSCRINGLDTGWWYRDVIALAEQGGERLDAIMLPKVGSPADLHAVDMLAVQAARNAGRARPIDLEAQIETAAGLVNVEQIAAGSDRLVSLHFGHADYAASMGMRTMEIGGDSPDYAVQGETSDGQPVRHWNDAWHYPLVRIIAAARAHGLLPIAGPYGKYTDLEGLAAQARRAAFLGCAGQWAIHPGQIDTINAAFSPTPQEVARAQAVLAALAEAQAQGRGAAALNGVLLDRVTIRQAEQIMARQGG